MPAEWESTAHFSPTLEAQQVGWDWLSLQLNDNTELMLFHIRLVRELCD
jgi:predicted secreted hydrolase